MGGGSERVAEQVARAFPRASVLRMDPETVGHDTDPGAADIYVTTWIGTKEVLRPDVSLVAVLDADILIRRPDYKAAEGAYHALAAMSAWAGPAGDGGRLLIQTRDPSHHAVQAVVRADHDYFVTRELPYREELSYPPFAELIKVTASGPGSADLVERVRVVARGHRASVLGPVAVRASEGRRGVAGSQLLVKCADASTVAADLRGILPDVGTGNRLHVDVDPR